MSCEAAHVRGGGTKKAWAEEEIYESVQSCSNGCERKLTRLATVARSTPWRSHVRPNSRPPPSKWCRPRRMTWPLQSMRRACSGSTIFWCRRETSCGIRRAFAERRPLRSPRSSSTSFRTPIRFRRKLSRHLSATVSRAASCSSSATRSSRSTDSARRSGSVRRHAGATSRDRSIAAHHEFSQPARDS